jgi:hypothetical protein
MSEDHFRLIYEGPAVDDGEMAIAQLAPSLLAFGKLVEALDALASGEASRVRVLVRADVRRGSFDIGLSLDFIHSVKQWLISPDGTAVVNLVTLLGINAGAFVGLIPAVRWLRGRKVKTKVVLEDGNVRIETADTEILIVPPTVARAIDDPNIRVQLERFTEPLREDGLDLIRFEGSDGPGEKIAAEEALSFVSGAGSDPTSQARFRSTYQIKRLYFERGKKWRLSNGAQTILAAIEDEAFWLRVEAADVAFTADDYLVCEVRMDQWLGGAGGLRTEYVVERVVEHIPAPPRQDRLPGA